MNPKLRPIKFLTMASFALHIFSLLVMAGVVVFQIPLGAFFVLGSHADLLFVLPTTITIVSSFVILAVHFTFAALFLKVIASENIHLSSLRNTAIFSCIFVILMPFISLPLAIFDNFLSALRGIEYLAALSSLNFLMGPGFLIRSLSLMALLMASSMIFYYSYIAHKK